MSAPVRGGPPRASTGHHEHLLGGASGYAIILGLLVLSYALCALQRGTDPSPWAFLVILVTVAVVFRVTDTRPIIQHVAWVILSAAGVATIVTALLGARGNTLDLLFSIASMVALLVAPATIIAHQVHRRGLNLEALLAAITAYVLVGLFFTFVFNVYSLASTSPMFGEPGGDSLANQLFFSFTTLTTTGYGNLVPVGAGPQAVAVAEAITGQLFLITAVARIMARNRRRHHLRVIRAVEGVVMKRWSVIAVLGSAQFVMVLDGTVMNVSISTVVSDLDTTVAAMQGAITFYTLTMAAFMLLGAKLGDVWGRRRAFVIGSCVYAAGSLITALSPNVQFLFLGWSVVEGLGAVLVIPAIAALVADNYRGRERVTAFAVIGAVSGAAVAAGPLIGGFVTTYFDWRYVFAAEVVIMIGVVLCARVVTDPTPRQPIRIDVVSVALSSVGLVAVVFGMLQSKTWGWVLPSNPPVVGGVTIAPLGISPAAWFIVLGVAFLALFLSRQRHLERAGRSPLVHVGMFSITALRSGLSVLGAQYTVTAGLFFMVPVYLQMTLGLDALETGIRIFPLSIALVLFSIVGTRLSRRASPRTIVRIGQLTLVVSALILLGSATSDLRSGIFATGMFLAGAALGLLASQLGNVNMSSVTEKETSEVGGLQGVFQNLGSSLGTALIGSILIGALSASFASGVVASDLPDDTKSTVAAATEHGVIIVPAADVAAIAEKAGLSDADSETLATVYRDSQLSSLRIAFFGLILISLLSLLFSKGIPSATDLRRRHSETTAT